MEIAVAIGAAVAILAVVVAAVLTARMTPRGAGPSRREPDALSVDDRGHAVVVLRIDGASPSSPAVQRLVEDAARRVFAARPDVMRVTVRSRRGVTLGTRERGVPAQVDIPQGLYEPHARRRSQPDVREGLIDEHEALPGVAAGGEPVEVPSRPLAERFELPAGVRERLRDPDDAVELVAALIDTVGEAPRVEGDTVKVGDRAVVVVRAPIGEPLSGAALSQAYHRFKDSGAREGVVVTPGFFDPVEVRRRELLAPELAHAGPDGIQRMCDAAAVGADPVALAAGADVGGNEPRR